MHEPFDTKRSATMAKNVHHGGKVGAAAKKLANPRTSKPGKSQAGKTLVNHKIKQH